MQLVHQCYLELERLDTPERSGNKRGVRRAKAVSIAISIALGILTVWAYWPRALPLIADGLGHGVDFSEPGPLSDSDSRLAKQGQYGDSFGALNALFTGLALAGVGFTLYLQIREIRELEEKRVAEEEQQRIDRFEGIFFRQVEAWRSLVHNFVLRDHPGKACLRILREEIEQEIEAGTPGHSPSFRLYVALSFYEDCFYARYQDFLGPYFRVLYHVFRLIDRSQVQDKHFYSDLGSAKK